MSSQMHQDTSRSDPDLVRAAQAGDRQALELLWTRHAPKVARFAGRMCRSPTEAEDIVQDTLLAATRTLAGFRGEAQVSTWLYQIARSFCIKRRRRGRSLALGAGAQALDDADPVAPQADSDHSPEVLLGQADLGQAVANAIANLAPMYREVLVLRDVEGLTAGEVAQALGLGEAAVKSRLHRARQAIRSALAPVVDDAPLAPANSAGCPDIVALYSRHLEGDISAQLCSQMQAHLAQCPACQGRCDALQRTLALCRTSPGPMVPVGTQFLVRRALARALGSSGPDDGPRGER